MTHGKFISSKLLPGILENLFSFYRKGVTFSHLFPTFFLAFRAYKRLNNQMLFNTANVI